MFTGVQLLVTTMASKLGKWVSRGFTKTKCKTRLGTWTSVSCYFLDRLVTGHKKPPKKQKNKKNSNTLQEYKRMQIIFWGAEQVKVQPKIYFHTSFGV